MSKVLSKDKNVFLLGLFSILTFYIPFIINGEDSHIQIHDNLDCDFIYQHLLKLSGNLFNTSVDSVVPSVLNGLNASYIHSNFNFLNFFFLLFPSYWAYILNGIVVRFIGFTGTWYLGKNYFSIENKKVLYLISLIFALLAARTIYGITIFGLPFLFWAFLNLKNNQKQIFSFFYILFYAFYSHFVLIGPFILTAVFLYFYFTKALNKNIFLGLVTLFFGYVAFNATFIINYIFGEESHRSVWEYTFNADFYLIKNFIINLVIGHTHTASIVSIPALILMYWNLNNKAVRITFIVYILLCIFYGFESWVQYFSSLLPIMSGFDFSRFSALKPIVYLVLLFHLVSNKRTPIRIIYLVLIIQLGFNFIRDRDFLYNSILVAKIDLEKSINIYNNKIIKPLNGLLSKTDKKKFFKERNSFANIQTFNQFFDPKLYNEVKEYIGASPETYRVVNIGLPPAVTQYNGFYTLDAFQVLYPLRHKKNMMEMSGNELFKKNVLFRFGNNHGAGHYCFLFSDEFIEKCKFPTNVFCKSNIDNFKIKQFKMNPQRFQEMGGKYIFSVVEILNAKENQLSLEKIFRSNISKTKIFLYKSTNEQSNPPSKKIKTGFTQS